MKHVGPPFSPAVSHTWLSEGFLCVKSDKSYTPFCFHVFCLVLKITELYILFPHHVKLQMFTGFILSFVELTPLPMDVFCF